MIGFVFAAVVLGFSWLIATIPVERLYSDTELLNPLVRAAYQRMSRLRQPKAGDDGWPLPWLVSYRVMVVEDTDLVPDESDKYGEVSRVIRGRDLRFAQLNRSDLHRADLTKADLRGARLNGARLEKAKLEKTKLQGADLGGAELEAWI